MNEPGTLDCCLGQPDSFGDLKLTRIDLWQVPMGQKRVRGKEFCSSRPPSRGVVCFWEGKSDRNGADQNTKLLTWESHLVPAESRQKPKKKEIHCNLYLRSRIWYALLLPKTFFRANANLVWRIWLSTLKRVATHNSWPHLSTAWMNILILVYTLLYTHSAGSTSWGKPRYRSA